MYFRSIQQAVWFTHYRRDTDLSVFLFNCIQAGAKVRAHISGPWPWLQPVCLSYYTYFKKYFCKTKLFQVDADGYLMAAILYPRLQWAIRITQVHWTKIIKSHLLYISIEEPLSHNLRTGSAISLLGSQLLYNNAVTNWAKTYVTINNVMFSRKRHMVEALLK